MPDLPLLAWLPPLVLAAAGLLATARDADRAWRIALGAAAVAPMTALLAWSSLPLPAALMLLLVLGVGSVTLRFAHRYLDGAPRRGWFARWFLLTLAAAATVVVTRDLVVLALAWTATSLSLHRLLTFAEGRAAAEMAAHKKFLLSRVADVLLFAAVALLVVQHGTTSIDGLLADVSGAATLSARDAVAATLIAIAVVLRSAQLPFHGWLIQVMEAPTPVSALLHAGIVNLGAYVCIALAPLLTRAAAAQWTLLLAGSMTVMLAGLVLLTQGSIKGRLAWSTCAQMGFVLVELGLGLPEFALLHVLAHGTYKAHAFLRSGSAVAPRALRGSLPTPRLATQVLGALIAATLLGASVTALGLLDLSPATVTMMVILGLAMSGILATALAQAEARARLTTVGGALLLVPVVAVAHLAIGESIPAVVTAGWPAAVLAMSAFVSLFALQGIVRARPDGALARRLHPHAHAGFHLDAIFTRLTFRLWPPTPSEAVRVARTARAPMLQERAA